MPSISPAEFEAFRRLPVEDLLRPVLLQLVVLIVAARLFGALFRKFGQSAVVGEIAAGLVLGPSLLGWVAPDLSQFIFRPTFEGVPHELSDPAIGKLFAILSEIGLIFLLFLVGLEFDFSHLKDHGRSAVAISLAGIALPFVLGVAISPILLPRIEEYAPGEPVPALGFTLFLGVALSITALPVLGRMMLEWRITRTKLGTITISAAALEDAIGWVLLATIASVVRSRFDLLGTAKLIGLFAGFSALMIFVARPLATRWARWAMRRNNGQLSLTDLVVVLVGLMLSAIATSLIGIFGIFGAFLFGAILSGESEFREAIVRRLHDMVTSFFLPIFFTYTGLRTDVRSLGSAEMWLLGGLILAASVIGKIGGCGLAAWAGGLTKRESACVGTMMNTRGLMELIIINLGYEMHVIPKSVFCMLVLMALITTCMTTPLLRRLVSGTELEEPMRQAGYVR